MDDQPLRQAITEGAEQYPTYGPRRTAKQLGCAPYQLVVNRKRARRVMRELGLLRLRRPRQRRTTNSQHPFRRFPNLVSDRVAQAPDEIGVSDITYIHRGTGCIYLARIMDVFTRDMRGWQLGRSRSQDLTLLALQHARATHTPVIHPSDQGIPYAAPQYVPLLRSAGVQVSMAAVGAPRQNGYAERVIRPIKEEEIDLADYRDFDDALAQIGRFIDDGYRTKRTHSALGYLTPSRTETARKTVQFLGSITVLHWSHVLEQHKVNYLQDIDRVVGNLALEAAIQQIPGHRSGVSLGYFYILAGSTDYIKPDRMILRFIQAATGRWVSVAEAQTSIVEACRILQQDYPALTPALLDHLIWQYQRAQPSA